MLQFRVLGPLEVLDGGSPVPLAGRNQRALLTLLLLRVNEPVSSERLIDLMWGEHPPKTAATSLQNTVAQLRKLLGAGILHTRPTGYVLELDRAQLDLAQFEDLVRGARSAAPSERVALLREALALWRGAALADSELEEFAQEETRRLEELRLAATEELLDAELDEGADAELVPELQTLVRRYPLRERLREQLMLALYRSGRQADALAAFHEARRFLVEELGIEPGPRLQELHRSILHQERSLIRAGAPALDDHYDEVIRALLAGRLVPVLGPGAGDVAGALVRHLCERFDVAADGRSLAWVSQVVAARNGVGPLHDELHLALAAEVAPGGLARWLAALPALLRARGVPQQLIVSTAFDTAIERAFAEAGEPLDVVLYVASGRHRGKFLHVAADGERVVVDEPNAYSGLALEDRPALLKIHGHCDGSGTRDLESFAVCEDDHIDYLVGGEGAALPVQLAARLRRGHLLFLGYAIDDWSLRVFLRRVWGGDRIPYRSWAVQPAIDSVAAELWRERDADVFEVSLDAYVGELARLTGESAA